MLIQRYEESDSNTPTRVNSNDTHTLRPKILDKSFGAFITEIKLHHIAKTFLDNEYQYGLHDIELQPDTTDHSVHVLHKPSCILTYAPPNGGAYIRPAKFSHSPPPQDAAKRINVRPPRARMTTFVFMLGRKEDNVKPV